MAESAAPIGVAEKPGLVTDQSWLQRTFGALGDSNFRLLYLGNVMQFGSMQMQLVVRGWLVFHLTGLFAALGTMALANAVPGLLLSPVGGVLADRAPKTSSFTVSSDYPIARIADPDDGRALTRDASVMGSFDFYGDVDVYTLDLREGQTVAVTAESTLANPVLLVARADGSSTATLDSTSTPIERGLLGNDAVLLFTASADRRYFIVVTDYSLLSAPQHGACRLSVFSSQPACSTKGFGTITSGDRPGQAAGAFVFGGGSDEGLLTATGCSRAGLRAWASRPDGSFVTFVPGATVAQANAAWTEAFPFGIPAATALVGQCLR